MRFSPQHRTIAGLVLGLATIAASFAAPALKGNPERAIPLVTERCAGCHGQDGNSPIPNFPRLAGMNAQYLLKELQNFKSEQRSGDIMKAMAAALSDTEMTDLALYFSKQKPVSATVTRPELLALGKKIFEDGNDAAGVPSCSGCHEEDGSGSARFPRVAGQNPEYVLEELGRYLSIPNHRSKVMRTVAQRLSKQEAQAVAEYMASLQ